MTNDSQSKVGGHTKTKKRCHTDDYINKSILSVEFSVVHIILYDPHSSLFKSYVVFLGHNKVNILLDDWKDVPDGVKKSIWTIVQLKFEFSDDSKLKKKWITYAGTTWRSFKSWIMSDYITKPKANIECPWVKYHFLYKKVWKKFVKSRNSEKFMVSTTGIF
ncbi:unnamed protein product [Lathyrus oleraceus]